MCWRAVDNAEYGLHLSWVVFLEQDTGLEALSSVIGRQKQMALDLGNEVDNQNGNRQRWKGTVHCRLAGSCFLSSADDTLHLIETNI